MTRHYMRARFLSVTCAFFLPIFQLFAQGEFEKDTIKTSAGALEMTFIGHGSLMMEIDGKTIHVDPFSKVADYEKFPDADLVLITHHHGDHLDLKAMEEIRTVETEIVLTEICAEKIEGGIVMKNGDAQTVLGMTIEAVPAYNLVHKRPGGALYHPKGEGNGYIITFGDTRVYVAGDTENTLEMKTLEDIDIAFLPMNLPYTMTPEMVADAAKAFRPKVFYPYHYGKTDPALLLELLQDSEEIEIRIRQME
jgi:L-ascorbate metabolism protein UlaG (beta-lactamase superfamily)